VALLCQILENESISWGITIQAFTNHTASGSLTLKTVTSRSSVST